MVITTTTACCPVQVNRQAIPSPSTFLVLLSLLLSAWPCWCELNVVYHWDKIDLSLSENHQEMVNGTSYVPENNLVHRMKIWNGTLYMAVPRFKPGVPATLCESHRGTIRPFPSLGLQVPGNCVGMQNVKDIEIDHLGRLWVLDVGMVNELDGEPDRTCDPKLVVLDLGTGRFLRSAVVPSTMFTDQSVLSGISLDLKSPTAVVADLGPDAGFIVYDFRSGCYRKFPCKMLQSGGVSRDYDEALLTVSPIDDLLYFTTVQSGNMFTIPLSVFGVQPLRQLGDVGHYVNDHGPKADSSTAMIMDTTGNLYLGMTRKVVAWNTVRNGFDVKELYIQEVRLDWISSFAFDTKGYLWITSSAFRDFLDGSSSRRMNIRIFKRFCGTTAFALQSSMQQIQSIGENDTALPVVRSSAVGTTNTATSVHVFTLVGILSQILS